MAFTKEEYRKTFSEFVAAGRIRKSTDMYKIRLFLKKGETSLQIAEHFKTYVPCKGEPEKHYWNYWAITIFYYSMLYAAKAGIHSKGYCVYDHDAAQIALGHLLVPDKIQKEDLELLNQSYKIFEDEYITYFEDAKKESHIARYAAIKTYNQRRLDELSDNASKFVAKISLMLVE